LNSGPNLTTYILSAECFPTCCRATCHGVSAGCGKLGACVGTAAFPLLQRYCGAERGVGGFGSWNQTLMGDLRTNWRLNQQKWG
jgi:hypothetical protein